MEAPGSYAQFCPVAMAAEVLCTRWTPLVIRELIAGSTRFNDLRRGVPRMSPALLSKRLRELEQAGILERFEGTESAVLEYRLTPAGLALGDVVDSLGYWGQQWVEAQVSLKHLDPSLLMWDIRRNLNTTPLPRRRCTIQFLYPELSEKQKMWWLVIEPPHEGRPMRETDLCASDPGFEVDLYVEASLKTMTAIWMGFTSVSDELRRDQLRISGEREMRESMQHWLGLSVFAQGKSPNSPVQYKSTRR
jgi:DNA-binding HxlR family transcriptional regulator